MPYTRPKAALALFVCALASCQQTDQQLPFELDGGGQTTAIDATGGIISVPPDFSLIFPAGSLTSSTSVDAAKRIAAFPSDAGELVSISSYDVGPIGTQLVNPARVQIKVPPELLEAGDELSLSVALLKDDGEVVTQATSYDLNSGLLTADITELGPVAAVVAADAIPVLDITDLPLLAGGGMAPPIVAGVSGSGPAQGPFALTGRRFTASCSTLEQTCFASGIVQIYADDVVRRRLGVDMVLYNATVDAEFEFGTFVSNIPTQAWATLRLDGELRARINRVVAGRRLEDEIFFFTGNGGTPGITTVTLSGNNMTLAQTSEGDPEILEYGIAGVGTGEQLTIQFDGEIEFSNPGGTPDPEIGRVVVQVRLRR